MKKIYELEVFVDDGETIEGRIHARHGKKTIIYCFQTSPCEECNKTTKEKEK